MIAYCINTILCSALLFILYKVLLENEKMHVFKRGYLGISIIISLIAPLITISFPEPQQYLPLEYVYDESVEFITNQSTIIAEETSNKMTILLTTVYFIGLTVCLFKLTKTVYRLIRKSNATKSVPFYEARLVLLEEDILPHTFLNNIFINKETYLTENIEKDILVHELAHVKQHHSLDILFTQLIYCVFWFNPFYILYLRAIQLNHEFLADEAVLNSSDNPLSYQYLLLQKSSEGKQYALTSPFNYLIIKKRLVMITKHTSHKTQLFKTMTAAFMFLPAFFLFSAKDTTGQKTEQAKSKIEVSVSPEASTQEVAEYEAIAAKYPSEELRSLSNKQKDRLYVLFTKMTKSQKEKQKLIFYPNELAKGAQKDTKKTITSEQLKTQLEQGIDFMNRIKDFEFVLGYDSHNLLAWRNTSGPLVTGY